MDIQLSEVEHLAGKYLTFRLDDEDYGIDILKIREIISMMTITRVPRMPEYVKGVINLRGKVIPVIDLRLKFGLNITEETRFSCVIVVEVAFGVDETVLVGLMVDAVHEVTQFGENQLEPAPPYGNGIHTDFILAMGKVGPKVKILLDIDKILDAKHAQELVGVSS